MWRSFKFTILRVDDLEVLHGGLRDAAVEVEHVRLRLLVPAGTFVDQGHQLVHVVVRMARQQGFLFLKASPTLRLKHFHPHIIPGPGS